MTNILPVSARDPFHFDPLAEAIADARAKVDDAQRRLDEAGETDFAAKLIADADLETAKAALEQAEAERARYGANAPKYSLLVPTYRTQQRLENLMIGLPAHPGNAAMLKALRAASADGLYEDEDKMALEALVSASKSQGNLRQEKLSSELTRLTEVAMEHPAVMAVVAKRRKAIAAHNEMTVRFHLLGWAGAKLPPFPNRNADGLADETVLDFLPPEHVMAVVLKVQRLQGVEGTMGNSSAAA